jgi:hypothetical protein
MYGVHTIQFSTIVLKYQPNGKVLLDEDINRYEKHFKWIKKTASKFTLRLFFWQIILFVIQN